MDLHVLLGPRGSGKAGRAVARVREAAASGGEAFLVVPGSVDRARFLRELAASEGGSVLGVEVGTFDQLVERLAGSPPVRRTDRSMERIIVRDALAVVPELQPAAAWHGFTETARRHVDRIRRARIWGGNQLEQALDGLPGGSRGAWLALEREVSRLLDERRLRDDAWHEARAVAAFRRGSVPVTDVVVYGFEALAPDRVELLERVARLARVMVVLPWRPGRVMSESEGAVGRARVYQRASDLRDAWRAKGAFIEEIAPDAVPATLVAWLGSELYESHPAPLPGSVTPERMATDVRFVDCCGGLQEVDEVVREVAELAADGLHWDDIAVASASTGSNDDMLLAAFARAGIPARLQSHRTARDTPAGRAVHELLAAIVDADPFRLVAALRARVHGISPQRVDQAELDLRAHRHDARRMLLTGSAGSVLPGTVRAVVEAHRDGRPVLDAVRSLIADLLPHDLGDLELLRGIVASFDGLSVAAGGDERVSLADISEAVASFPLAVPDRSDSGSVVVTGIDDLHSVRFDAIVLRRTHLAGFRARVDDEAEGPTAARDLLHLAVTSVRRRLRVVRQVAGADGGVLAASPAWLELRRLVPDAPLRARRLGEVTVAPGDVRLADERAVAVAFARGQGLDVQRVPAQVDAELAVAQRAPRRSIDPDSELARELAATSFIAVTSLEKYLVCSAKWFIESRLKFQDADADRSNIAAGDLAHGVLQAIVAEVRLDSSTTAGRVLELALAAAPEVARRVDRLRVLDTARIEQIARQGAAVLIEELEWATPDSIEVERTIDSRDPDAIFPGPVVDGVEVYGRIDRIDHYGSRALLHDYKYSSTTRSEAKLIGEHKLQLLIYLLALRAPGQRLDPLGGVYRAITTDPPGSIWGTMRDELVEYGVIGARKTAGVHDADSLDAFLDTVTEILSGGVRALKAGVVRPLESAAKCPSHCRLQTICRVGEHVA
ncbi:MAG: ATP-dependent nuclease subunit B-like protein [Thermoleophilia bacterium]|nr:ATP-dependent nuclease subunit B-like protein [Thermoleophilia bacterium]